MFYIIIVILPVLFWIWFFRRLDKKDPEPRSLLVKLFRLGFIAIFLAFIIEIVVDGALTVDQIAERYTESGFPILDGAFLLVLLSFFLAGPIEELTKYLVLKHAIFRNPHFNQVADGIIYGVTLALGFSFIENTGYFIDLYSTLPSEEFVIITVIRGISTTLLHVAVTGIMGLYLGWERFSGDKTSFLSLKGVAIAALLHGIYNVFVLFPYGIWINFLLVVFILGFLIYEFRRKQVTKIWFQTVSNQE
ncbi:MAG: PrsW family intramembrane metalloprotease [Patescibacteria group bacterium]|nr:PrsW family intramembrane metalloprotease [Patescibacteria group bacterium]